MPNIEVLTSSQQLEALAPEWQALFAETSLRTPSKSPLWQIGWWRHFGARPTLQCRHELRVFVLRDGDNRLIAVAPMMLTQRPGFGPSLFSELQFFGADPYVTQLRGPCCRREDLPAVTKALVAHVAGCRQADFVQWRGMAPGFGEDIDPNCVHQPQLDDVDSYLVTRERWEDFHAALPKKTRKHLRKSQNDLKAAGIAYTFRVVTAPEAVPASLARFFEMHAIRASLKDVVQHPNVFKSPVSRAFLENYCEQMAQAGDLRLFEILVNDRIVATRIGFALGDETYYYFSGYEPEYGDYSIMTTLMAEALRWSHDNGVRIVNLSSGVDRSKTRFRPQFSTAEGFYTRGAGWRSNIALKIMQKLRYGGAEAPPPQDHAEEANEECAGA
jgi:CelD/BcsL family acetyltransferase involved in cellulose biosynthesis